jgi:hypothetical protein
MSSVTSPQQTDRGGAETIPGPRGRQDVRLLVLGTDTDAQQLRDQALAAGFELAQRYSARVSHVAFGAGINPGDAKYNKIRDAGLAIVSIRSCASQLGLGEGSRKPDAAPEDVDVLDVDVAVVDAAVVDVAVVEVADADVTGSDAADMDPAALDAVDVDVADVVGDEDAAGRGEELPEFPPLQQAARQAGTTTITAAAELDERVDGDPAGDDELAQDVEDAYAPLGSLDSVESRQELPLGAAVIGADPWTGPVGTEESAEVADPTDSEDSTDPIDSARFDDSAGFAGPIDSTDITGFIPVTRASDLEAADAPVTEAAASAEPAADAADTAAGAEGGAAAAPARLSARYVLASFVWALTPFVTFGLLTPVVFGYAALRLRSRILAATTLGYTVAVVLSFALSAARPHAATPSDATGALLTLALAAAWIGGTVHAISLRVRVFAH